MNEKDFAELSAGRALGALTPEDELAFHEALQEHPEWRSIADADLETAAALGDSVTPVAPPLALRSQLLGRIRAGQAPQTDVLRAGEADAATEAPRPGDGVPPVPATPAAEAAEAPVPDAPPTDVVQTIQRRNWTRGMFALVASVALLIGIGWGVGAVTDALRTPPAVSTLAQIEAAPDAQEASGELSGGGEATLHWSSTVGEAVIVASGLPAIDSDRTFEMWFVRDGTPISAGTFDASDGEATALLGGEVANGDVIAVTIEQAGGSPEGTPTTDPIVAITPGQA